MQLPDQSFPRHKIVISENVAREFLDQSLSEVSKDAPKLHVSNMKCSRSLELETSKQTFSKPRVKSR